MSDPVASDGLENRIANAADMVLARQAQTGDRTAYQQLVNRHVRQLCAYLGTRLRRHRLVTKLAADTIFAAWRHISEWEPAREDFATWFRRTGAQVTMAWREKHPEEPLVEDFPADLCEDLEQVQAMRRLEDALGSLPERQRMCLEQHYRGGLDGKALGEALHLSEEQARTLLDRSHEALAEAFAIAR